MAEYMSTMLAAAMYTAFRWDGVIVAICYAGTSPSTTMTVAQYGLSGIQRRVAKENIRL